jgi:hypothetical protein
VSWDVEGTDEFAEWYGHLSARDQESVERAVEVLIAGGSGLGRPFVDTIKGSRHGNMKELRPRRGNIRILFAFDPRRLAILLIGGDKTDRWNEWYAEMIPVADQLYDDYLATLRKEGLI